MTLSFRVLPMLLVLALGAGNAIAEALFDPPGLMLTWQRDPLTTMTIDWHSLPEDERADLLEYRRLGAGQWFTAIGARHPFPFTERIVHRAELTGLHPGAVYEFRFGPGSEIYRFRTMPRGLEGPIRIALGGDTLYRMDRMGKVNQVALAYDPDFAVWGGDFAYADGREDRAYRWIQWFDTIKATFIDEDRRAVPIVGAVGNHEVRRATFRFHPDYEATDAFRESIAPYFFAFFAFPGQPAYNVLDFGDYLSLVILDSDHLNPIEDAQTAWLESVLQARQHVTNVFPVYHVPGYPSVRSFDGWAETRVREHWSPLFERHGVQFAFEHHDHTYKRTHPIRGGKVDPEGVVYFGDGAWGVSTRETHPVEETWYLKRAASRRHAIIATLQGQHASFFVADEDGVIIDTYPERPLPGIDPAE